VTGRGVRPLLRAALIAVLAVGSPLRAGAFSDAALIEGFLVTVFGAEARIADGEETSQVVKKFTQPVRYHVISTGSLDRRRTLARFMAELSASVQNLTLTPTDDIARAEMVIHLTDRADYADTIRATVWDGVNTLFLEENACSAVIAARRTGIERAFVYLVTDEGFASFAHCMVEEVAQSLGPANDSSDLPHSIFNDTSTLNIFGVFDWYILNMLYDARVRPGMTEAEVLQVLPQVIADVRRRLPHALTRRPGAGRHHAGR